MDLWFFKQLQQLAVKNQRFQAVLIRIAYGIKRKIVEGSFQNLYPSELKYEINS